VAKKVTSPGDARAVSTIQLRLIYVVPPGGREWREGQGVEFGLQDKDQAVHPGAVQADSSLQFEVDVRVRRDPKADRPRLSGPFVHGKSNEPFLYLSWKRKQPADSLWQRRLKVMLDGVTWDRVEHVWATGAALAARVMDTGGSRAVLSSDGWMVE
jgi:hypothetical protein